MADFADLRQSLSGMSKTQLIQAAQKMKYKIPSGWSKERIAGTIMEGIEGRAGSFKRSGMLKPANDEKRKKANEQADEFHEHLGKMDSAKADEIIAAAEEQKGKLSATDYKDWASRLLGYRATGTSKQALFKEVSSFVNRLAVSAAQTRF